MKLVVEITPSTIKLKVTVITIVYSVVTVFIIVSIE